jgi:hypothetical protein
MSIPSGQAPVSGSSLSDIDLIGRIKQSNDSAATRELVHRHTGIYISVIQKYEGYSDFKARANAEDLKEDKFVNIYQWALKYDPNRETASGKPMQFGSYVGEMAKFLCKGAISKGTEKVELTDFNSPENEDSVTNTAEKDSAMESVREQVEAIDEGISDKIAEKQGAVEKLLNEITSLEDDLVNKRVFKDIFNMRYGSSKPLTWRAIGAATNLTHEGARKLFMKHMEVIKERAGK